MQAGMAAHLYSVAKAGVIAMTQTATLELTEHDVGVNAVCPGLIATPLAVGKPGASEKELDRLRAGPGVNFQPSMMYSVPDDD